MSRPQCAQHPTSLLPRCENASGLRQRFSRLHSTHHTNTTSASPPPATPPSSARSARTPPAGLRSTPPPSHTPHHARLHRLLHHTLVALLTIHALLGVEEQTVSHCLTPRLQVRVEQSTPPTVSHGRRMTLDHHPLLRTLSTHPLTSPILHFTPTQQTLTLHTLHHTQRLAHLLRRLLSPRGVVPLHLRHHHRLVPRE